MKTKNENRTTNKLEYTRFHADIVARDAIADPGALQNIDPARILFGEVSPLRRDAR